MARSPYRFCRHARDDRIRRHIPDDHSTRSNDRTSTDPQILADYRASSNMDLITNFNPTRKTGPRSHMHVRSKPTIVLHYRRRIQNTVLSNRCTRIDYCSRQKLTPFTKLRRFRQHTGWMTQHMPAQTRPRAAKNNFLLNSNPRNPPIATKNSENPSLCRTGNNSSPPRIRIPNTLLPCCVLSASKITHSPARPRHCNASATTRPCPPAPITTSRVMENLLPRPLPACH
ncbi:MAG UNVERIFIED_CONTAM: hypothetical protein LVR18_17765 [Planctomycetaceae bacterium]